MKNSKNYAIIYKKFKKELKQKVYETLRGYNPLKPLLKIQINFADDIFLVFCLFKFLHYLNFCI
ncbi:hypothetical protein AJY57_05340 [Campylobacter jejuni]|nr:hypothetical protein AJY57_05340 [Campylobacter jejuni]OEV41799.1 hypothetical protein AJY58_03865 [Campylobacter jejuni]